MTRGESPHLQGEPRQFQVSLHSSRVSLEFRVSLYGFRVSLRAFRMTFFDSRIISMPPGSSHNLNFYTELGPRFVIFCKIDIAETLAGHRSEVARHKVEKQRPVHPLLEKLTDLILILLEGRYRLLKKKLLSER
jgi:hypothetical protein